MTLTVTPQEIVAQREASGSAGLLGKHPSWKRVRLGDIATIINGAAFSSRLFNKAGRGVPLIRIRDVGKDVSDTYYDGPYESQYLVRAGDLLVGMDGDFRTSTWGGSVGLLNQRVCKLVLTQPDLYNENFLELVLQGYLDAIWQVTSAVTVKHLSSRTIAEIPLPLPPVNEQQRIVTDLEEYMFRVSRADSQQITAVKRMESFRGVIFDAAVTGSLIASPVEKCDRLIGLKGKSGKKIDYSSLPGLPGGWTWRSAEEVCEKVVCGGTPRAGLMYSGSGEIPFIKVYNLTRDGRLDFTVRPTFIDSTTHEGLLKRSKVNPGDVLTNIVGPPLGKTAVVPILIKIGI